jgi:ribonuclease T1
MPADSLATMAVAELPPQGRQTLQLIREGGPFPYSKDGSVFGNRERLLPSRQRGYYLEYTVKTPGSRDRGARRIVCGGQPRTPDTCYYTGDHYASFSRIAE